MIRRLGLVAAAASALVGVNLVIAAIPVSQDATFEPSVEYAAGAFPESVAAADVDLDGKRDLVVANNGSGDISVLWGVGDGTFEEPTNFVTGEGSGPSSVRVADMTGDGLPDIVLSLDSTSQVVTWVQEPIKRSFNSAAPADTDSGPVSLVVADFDGDGKNDAVTANQVTVDGTVSFLQGNGDGTFAAAVNFPTAAEDITGSPSSVATADLNHDSKLDLVVANEDASSVAVLIGNGAGGFAAPVLYDVGSAPRSVALGDLNIDGVVDAVTADEEDDSVSVLLGRITDGAFTFEDASPVSVGSGSFPQAVAIWDYNLDGRPDVAVAASLTPVDGVAILRGDGTGFFPEQAISLLLPSDLNPYALAVGDLNNDFKPDLATANYEVTAEDNEATSVLLNTSHLLVGDANTDDMVTAADVEQTVEELFDGDGSIVIQVAGGRLASGPGADGNGDTFVSAADFVAIIAITATTSAGS